MNIHGLVNMQQVVAGVGVSSARVLHWNRAGLASLCIYRGGHKLQEVGCRLNRYRGYHGSDTVALVAAGLAPLTSHWILRSAAMLEYRYLL